MTPISPVSIASAGGTASEVVPRGVLKMLSVDAIKPSAHNPRKLFDKLPLEALRDNIRINGVLVPITVYEIQGQDKYAILDGQRRYQCCVDLRAEGHEIEIPANIVEPPDKIAGILYMFSIHNFREQWELMPTALSLKTVMEALREEQSERLEKITGLSEPQIERCKILLTFPKRFQDLSLDPNPKTRIPANFWIEAYPVLNVCEQLLPDLVEQAGRDGITDRLVAKYRARSIRSIIHFRRIMEAVDLSEGDPDLRTAVADRLADFMNQVEMETRSAFDEFIVDPRRIQGALRACDTFVRALRRAKLEHISERDELVAALASVQSYVANLLTRLEGGDSPDELDERSGQEGG
jgi:ParB family chromosome partitioning protein